MKKNNNKVVVGHQPQYFPYIGIFDKILKSDYFMLVDSTKFVKKVWHNRTIIKDKKNNVFYFTVPTINNGYQIIKDVKISDHNWKKKHLKSIRLNYNFSKYFDELYPDIEKVLNNRSDFLIDYTIPSMLLILKKVGFNENNIFKQSEAKISGEKNQLIVNITKYFNSNSYLSGEGSKNYIDENFLKKKGIKHIFNKFVHPVYLQHGTKFIQNLSVIDCIFNIGFNGLVKILNFKE